MQFNFIGMQFDISKIKVGMVTENEFLKKYAGSNSVFEAEELQALKNDLKKFIEDGVLDENEAITWYSQVMNISKTAVQNMFKTQGENKVETALQELFYEEFAKQTAIKSNCDEINKALEMYHQGMGGAISKAYNSVKEFFNSEYAGDRVYRQLAKAKVSADMVAMSENNALTGEEYINTKIDLLECLLGTDKLSPSEKEVMKKAMMLMTMSELNDFTEQLANADDAEYENLKNNLIKKLKSMVSKGDSEIGFVSKRPNSLGSLLNSPNAKQKLSFSKTFFYENGVEYNSDNINDYLNKQRNFNRIASINNLIATQYNNLDENIKDGKMEDLNQGIKNALETLYGRNEKAKYDFLEKNNVNNLDNLNKTELQKIAKALQKELKNQLDKLLQGKKIEDYAKELENSKTLAFGKKNNIELAENFAQDQAEGVGKTKMLVSGVGFIASILGGPMTLIGIGIACAGGATVSLIEEGTKEQDIPDNVKKEILKELGESTALTISGAGIGKTATVIGKEVAKRCPALVGAIAEYGSDAIMSLVSSAMITGEIDLAGEGIAQIINIATGIAVGGGKTIRREKGIYRELEHRTPARTTISGRTLDDVMPVIERMCQKYNADLNHIVNTYLKGLDTNLVIFRDEETLKEYIETIFNYSKMRNKDGNLVFGRKLFHWGENKVFEKVDEDLIREIALLRASSPNMKIQLDRMCYLTEIGRMTVPELKKTMKYFNEGYVSPSTIDICLSNNGNTKVTNLIDDVKPDKSLKKERKTIIDTLERFSPEIKSELKKLKKELGDDFYRIKWETLANKNLNNTDYLNFIQDARNLKYLKDIELEGQNFFIKIPGYGQNVQWANAMSEITETASHMMREGAGFDEAMAYIAARARELALQGNVDIGKGRSYGIVRTNKEGYLTDATWHDSGAITPFDKTSNYYSYAEKFKKCYPPNELNNPYAGRIELTRLTPEGGYPIKAENYNPNNPKHVKEVKPDGSVKYYEKVEAMIHPKGKYGAEGLNIAKELHDDLIKKYKGKPLKSKDVDAICEQVAEIHWVLAHTMPWGRGSDAIANSYVKAVFQSLGIKTYPPKDGVSFDLEAFCTELSDYKKMYKNLYERSPEIQK